MTKFPLELNRNVLAVTATTAVDYYGMGAAAYMRHSHSFSCHNSFDFLIVSVSVVGRRAACRRVRPNRDQRLI